jgi:iron complex outermembrane recepter protein
MRTSVGCLVRFAVAGALSAVASAALAQEASATKEAAEPQELQEITVTGSRIVRSDFKSDSPMVSLSADVLKNTGEVGIDQQLNKLPQFVPGANQVTSAGDIQSTPTNSPGISTVNLRGLGTNRTLVLLDGRRTQPNNASLVVDINTIPSAALEGVEIITGGAGSAYGADAVAGVVNFKLKHNYEGVTLDAQSGETFRHDGAQTQLSALIGSNFADDRGNAIVSLTYAKRDAIYNLDRPFERQAYLDPGTAAIDTFGNYPGAAITATQGAYDSVFGGYPAGTIKPGTTVYFMPSATTAGASIFSETAGKGGIQAPGYTGPLFPNYKYLSNGNLGANSVNGFASLPLTRFSAFSEAHLKVNDHVTAYLQTNFDDNETVTQSGGWSPSVLQWGVTVPYDSATSGAASGHPVPASLATLLNARSAPNAGWALQNELDFMGPVNLDTTTKTYEILAGVRGDIGIKDWTYDAYVSHGDTSQYVVYNNFVDLASYQALINLPNYGTGADFNNGRIGQLAHCTSGVNPFLNTPVTQDCKNIIAANASTTTDLKQNVAELDIQGAIAPLPAGDLRFAVGADYRNNKYAYNPSKGLSTTNITSLTIGEFDTSTTQGRIGVTEGYAELLAPLLKDLPAVKSFNVDVGYRYSDYSSAGGVNTWKATADWDVNGFVKFRGGRQVANRAPNVAELFQPAVFLTVPWTDHDPCSNVTRAPWGNVAANPNRKQVQALCTALAGGFKIDDNYVGNQPLYFPLGRDLQQGNTALKSENASTWTVGAVLQSPWEDTKALRHLSLSLDYYTVTIKGAIAPATTAITYQECFNVYGTNPNYDPNNAYCKLILRSPINGFWLATNAQYQNLGEIKTSGVDSQLDWNMETFGNQQVFATLNFNYLAAYDVQQVAGGAIFHYAGTIGSPISAPPYGAQFRWKTYTNLGYRFGPARVQIDWRHLPRANNIATVTSPGSGTLPVGSYDLFGLNGSWSVTSHFDVRAGIDNLMNRQPPNVGVWPGVTNAAGVTDVAGSYDVIGRRFFAGFTARF